MGSLPTPRPERVRTPLQLIAFSLAGEALLVWGAIGTAGGVRVAFAIAAIVFAFAAVVVSVWLGLKHGDKFGGSPVHFKGADASQSEVPVELPPGSDWETMEEERKAIYESQRGLFLVHSWRPSTTPGQVADIVVRLCQHGPGPLSDKSVKGVAYNFGDHFSSQAVVRVNADEDFRYEVSAFAPMLCIARVTFSDGHEPLTLTRYIDFPVSANSDTGHVVRLDEMAHLHLKFIEEHGQMTMGESKAIRRERYGDDIRGTSRLFGTKGSNSILYREVDHGTPSRDSQVVRLTEHGLDLARDYRARYGVGSGTAS